MRKTAVEIIRETVAYYSKDPYGRRGIDPYDLSCVYLTSDGKMCAVGRCCIEPKERWTGSVSHLIGQSGDNIDHLLKEEYRGHPTELWTDLQHLHDNEWNWDNNGISEIGMRYAEKLLSKYN